MYQVTTPDGEEHIVKSAEARELMKLHPGSKARFVERPTRKSTAKCERCRHVHIFGPCRTGAATGNPCGCDWF